MTRRWGPVLGAVAVIGFGILVATRPAAHAVTPAERPASPDADAAPVLAVEAPAAPANRTELVDATATTEPISASAGELLDPTAPLLRAREELRSALEASLFRSLDPAAILDSTLALGSLEVDPRAYSEPDPSGCTVYPLIGAPEGTRAELWVGRSSKPEVKRVLSLRVELDAATHPYLLEGCARSKAIVQVQMQLGHDGDPLNMTILTDLPPSSRNRDLGVALDAGTIAQGVVCFVDAEDPGQQWRARTHGLKEGIPGSWDEPSLLVAGRWPCPDKVDAFRGLLLSQYDTIRH